MTDLDLSDDEKSNGGSDRSGDKAENSTNQRDNNEDKLDPYRLENLLLDDIDDDLTEHHTGADRSLAQLIKMNQEARKSMRVAKEKAYLSGRLQYDDLLKIALSGPFGLRGYFNDGIKNDLVNPFFGDINICIRLNNTAEGRGSAALSEKLALSEHLGYLPRRRSAVPKSMMMARR